MPTRIWHSWLRSGAEEEEEEEEQEEEQEAEEDSSDKINHLTTLTWQVGKNEPPCIPDRNPGFTSISTYTP